MKADTETTRKILYAAPKKQVLNEERIGDLKLGMKVLEVMEILPWASKRHVQLWIRGEAPKRDSGIEGALKQLVDRKKLKTVTIGNGPQLAYTRRRVINEEEVPHFLGNSECLVRMKLASPEALVISEKELKGQRFGVIAEGGFHYPNGALLLLESSTKRDWKKTRRLERKITAYRKSFKKIKEAYGATPFVLFVADVDRELVARMVAEFSTRAQEEDLFYFTDYETFKKVEIGEARHAAIYYFADGKEYNLT
jgi:hypothetical protein